MHHLRKRRRRDYLLTIVYKFPGPASTSLTKLDAILLLNLPPEPVIAHWMTIVTSLLNLSGIVLENHGVIKN
jgi:hypothetical protein